MRRHGSLEWTLLVVGACACGSADDGSRLLEGAGGAPSMGNAAGEGGSDTGAVGTSSAGGATGGIGGTGSAVVTGGAPSAPLSDGGAVEAGVPIPPPTPGGCITDVSAGRRNVPCDGLSYELSVPQRCLETQCGLIFDVHGGTMSGLMEDKNTKLADLGEQYGYVVVHPNAVGGLWNYAIDDPKVLAFMLQVRDVFHVDANRLHMTGMSQGGYMSWRFLCQHTDLLASVAPAAAAGPANISIEVGCTFAGADVPSGEIDILYMHGTQDALVNFPNAIALRDAIVAHYGMGPGEEIAGDGTYLRTRYTAPGGHVFEFLQHDYVSDSSFVVPILGHCFPGSEDQTITLPNQLMSFGCNPPNAFTWGEEVIRFFMDHPKR